MKLAAMTIVYNEEKLIRGAIKSFEPFVDKHLVMIADKPFNGPDYPKDDTHAIAYAMGCEVEHSTLTPEHKMRNAGMMMLDTGEYDWILVNDADMWFEYKTVKALIDIMRDSKEDILTMSQFAYWRDTDHVLVGDDFAPVVAMRPHRRFTHIGNADGVYRKIDFLKLHHLNWCEPKDILKKVKTYSHAEEYGDGDTWYKQYYLGWKEGQKVRFPKGQSFEVAYKPLPDELKAYLV